MCVFRELCIQDTLQACTLVSVRAKEAQALGITALQRRLFNRLLLRTVMTQSR